MSTKVTKSNGETYEINVCEPRHLSEVLNIMRENFYHEESMFKSLCTELVMNEDEKRRIEKYFDGTVLAALGAAPCLIAVHEKSEKIVGVNIITVSENARKNGIEKDGLATIFSSDDRAPTVVKKYIEYLSRINQQVKLFDAFPDAPVIWEFYAVAIDKDHRRLGLASDLINAGINLAKKSNVPLVFGVFTSIYSKKSATNVAMKTFMEFDLTKYLEPDETAPVFKNILPNNIVTVMIKKL